MEKKKEIKFVYNKSPHYTSYMADGVIGGLTLRGG
jgi:hypothetical protein